MVNKGILNRVFHISVPTVSGRNELWDFIRGMAMLSVLLHHSGVEIGSYILAFHMPFFFVLSGYIGFENEKKEKFAPFVKKRFFRLMLPYYLFEAVNLILWQLQMVLEGNWQDITEALASVLLVVNTDGYTGLYGRLWFLPCMFVSDIFFYAIRRCTSAHKSGLCLWAIVVLALSWVTAKVLTFRLPLTIDTALFATFFMIFGYLFGKQIRWILSTGHIIWDLIVMIFGFLALYLLLKTGTVECLMFVNYYGNYVTTVAAALCGSISFFVLSKWSYVLTKKVGIAKKLVLWYGHNSLVTFPVHLTVKIYALRVSWAFGIWQHLFLTMLILNVPVVNMITEYFPIMTGKIPRPKNVRAHK